MNKRFFAYPFGGPALLAALIFTTSLHTIKAEGLSQISYDVLKREQRSLGNVLTDGETDLANGETRLRNNSMHLSAEDVARAASKVAHLRAMAQLHPERCARTTGAFLMTVGSAQQSLTNKFFAHLKPRIVRLEDDLNAYLFRLEHFDPKLAAELRALIEAYDEAARSVVNGNTTGVIEYDPEAINKRAHELLHDQRNTILDKVDPNGSGGSGGGGGSGVTSYNGNNNGAYPNGGNNSNGGNNGNYPNGGYGNANANGGYGPISNVGSYRGVIRDTGGQILNADDFLDNKTLVKRTKSDNGILTKEEKTTGDLVPDGNGGAVFKKTNAKAIDWQFDIEANESGFALVDRSSGAADDDKGFSVQSWTVKDPTGQTQDFPGASQLKYPMTASGKYMITAKVLTKLKTSFIIFISPVNN